MKFSVSPAAALADEPISVVVTDLRPGSRVRIVGCLVDLQGVEWRSEGHYDADMHGRVDVAQFASIGGTYDGVDGRGLLWSMLPHPSPAKVHLASFPPLASDAPHDVTFTAHAAGESAQALTIKRTWSGENVVRHEVREGRLRGVFHQPSADSKRTTGILVISGSEGGVSETLAPLLASRGFPTFALAYFGYSDLPSTLAHIPLEYFAEAAAWLRSRVKRVAVVGISRGSEAAALTAAHFNNFADALVLYVPSHVVEAGIDPSRQEAVAAWTYGGQVVPFVPTTQSMLTTMSSSSEDPKWFTPVFLEKWSQPQVVEKYGIPVKRITSPILLLSAANDALWPSWIGAAHIEASAASRVEHVSFQGAGHLISRPGIVTSQASTLHHPHAKLHIALGGIPRLNAAASLAAYEHAASFIAEL